MKTLSHFLCLAFTLFTLQAWAANVAYKCTTATGEISFLDKKPTDGCATIEVVNISAGTPASADGEPMMDDAEAMAEQDRKEIAEREIKAKEECRKRKGELDMLKSRSQVTVVDPQTGEKKALSQEEHQAKIHQYEEYLAALCKEPSSSGK